MPTCCHLPHDAGKAEFVEDREGAVDVHFPGVPTEVVADVRPRQARWCRAERAQHAIGNPVAERSAEDIPSRRLAEVPERECGEEVGAPDERGTIEERIDAGESHHLGLRATED